MTHRSPQARKINHYAYLGPLSGGDELCARGGWPPIVARGGGEFTLTFFAA